MLVLTRYPGQSIIINGGTENEIEIKILERVGSQVRIGVDAPRHITINRNEIEELIKNDKKEKVS